jgi:hypothetical protein
MEDYVTIDAPLDKSVLLQQASLIYRTWEAEKDGPNARLLMGVASILFRLHEGSLELKQNITKANMDIY